MDATTAAIASRPISEAKKAALQSRYRYVPRRRWPGVVLHAIALLWYLRVWLWHFTRAAAALPGASGFGWFFRYLTFYTFTLQLIQLSICCIVPYIRDRKRQMLVELWADDLSCALFGMANAVTIMYYVIEAATHDLVEGGRVTRPFWLGFAVHISNSLVAWADLLLGYPRTFSKRSEIVSVIFTLGYTAWILVCSKYNGVFPYPFLNKLPWPQGFIGMVSAAVLLLYIMFKIGKQLSRGVLHIKLRIYRAKWKENLNGCGVDLKAL